MSSSANTLVPSRNLICMTVSLLFAILSMRGQCMTLLDVLARPYRKASWYSCAILQETHLVLLSFNFQMFQRFTISALVFVTTVWNLDKLNAQWSSAELVLFPSLRFKLSYNHSQNKTYDFRNTFCCTFTMEFSCTLIILFFSQGAE